MSKFAVIETGGKQYLVSEGQKIKIEKISAPKDGIVKFDKVLLVADKTKLELGKPYLKESAVQAKLVKEGRTRKVIVFKYKPKKRYRVKRGHRQHFMEFEITKIGASAEKTSTPAKKSAQKQVKSPTKTKPASR
jgi:large subunit ribosomal protein L21